MRILLPTILVCVVTAVSATSADAISRYNTGGMTCSAIRGALAREGAAVLRYPSKRVAGLPLYDRYVSSDRFCASNEYAEDDTVPAKDTDACPVLRCKTIDYDDCSIIGRSCFDIMNR